MKFKYKRILVKFSGEALAGTKSFGLDFKAVRAIAKELVILRQSGVDLAVVVGGGNIFRGKSIPRDSIDQSTADYMGMIGTVINALALQAEIEKAGGECRVLTALSIKEVAEDYIRRRATSHLKKGRIVLFAAGTGNPYFTTDTAAALRALEIGAEVLLKATTHVDGIYTGDPRKSKSAKKLKHVDSQTALEKHLHIMDSTAFSLCQDNKLPIVVFKYQTGAIAKILHGQSVGTLVDHKR
ncbi:MAG: UMP kinase [Patescibacteria group bacterium]